MQELPDFPFRRAAHDRMAERRSDDGFVSRAWDAVGTRVLVMQGSDPAVQPGGHTLAWVAPDQAPSGERVLLGSVDGVVHFAVLTPEATGHASGRRLRDLAMRLDETDAGLAVHAVGLANWHATHPRCAACGGETDLARAGECRACPTCGTLHFPRSDPAVIMLVVDAEERALLGHNIARRTTWYSTLAGFVEPGETPEQAVVREVREEAGIHVTDVRYAGSQPWPFPSSLMLGFFARATTTDVVVDGVEIGDARWFTRAEVRRRMSDGSLVLPTRVSIAGALISSWYGAELPVGAIAEAPR